MYRWQKATCLYINNFLGRIPTIDQNYKLKISQIHKDNTNVKSWIHTRALFNNLNIVKFAYIQQGGALQYSLNIQP